MLNFCSSANLLIGNFVDFNTNILLKFSGTLGIFLPLEIGMKQEDKQ
jgi:hypothetical protein